MRRRGRWLVDARAPDPATATGSTTATSSTVTTTPLPDPRSRRQPDGVHALSRTFDPARFSWTDHRWTGRQLAGSCIYELHVGTFTPEGTLDAAVGKLDHLVDLGVDFVELLPVNAFNGAHNWGYDGVLWFAVTETYGGPEAYQRFVDDCHARGLAVVQDVVYNHLGPSGNYLPRFGPYLHDESAQHVGRVDQPRRAGGAPLHRRQRADVAARLPRRRAAPRRRARARRHVTQAHPPRARRGGRGAVGGAAPSAHADRRERSQRPAS